MTYKVESINSCTKKLVFNIEGLDLSNEIKQALTKKQKSVNLKGFRKGKAPVAMVEKLFGPQIESDAVNNFIQAQLYSALNHEKLRVIGYPSLENMKYETGKKISFDATVEIFPDIKLKDYSKLSFKKPPTDVSEDDLKGVKTNYLNSRSQMVEVKDEKAKAKRGQFVVINFQGEKADGSRPENMKGEEFLLELGANQFIPGFEEGLEGAKKGEKKTLNLTFPADYHMSELQNAKVKFEVEVLELKEKVLPDFTDELAKEFGFESVADFDQKNKETLKSNKERQSLQDLHQQILEKLVGENQFDVPKTMMLQQENHVREDLKNNLKQQGFNDVMVEEYFDKWAADIQKKAEFQVRSGLILDSLANEYKIETSDKDFDAKIEEMAKGANVSVDEVKKYYKSNDNIKKNLMYAIREEKTFEVLKSKMKVS